MTKIIGLQRNSCLLHGALQTVKSIENAVPIIHSTAGCGIQQYFSGTSLSGNGGSGYTGGFSIPSTNVIEKQVVFGGTSRLREQIKNTVKVQLGDVYVVLTGCTTELVGDDVPAMTKEAQEQGYPVITVSTPGFKGEIHEGYVAAVRAIIHQLDKFTAITENKIKGLVNIFGIVPEQDVFWRGNLEEIKRILEAIGLKVNTLFGVGQGVGQWAEVPAAELNIVISSWGLPIGDLLEEKYETPFIYFDYLPVGPKETTEFIDTVGERLKLDLERIGEFTYKEEKRVAYYIENSLDSYFRYNFKRSFALVGDSALTLGINSFLSDPLSLIPEVIIITDNVNEKSKKTIKERLKNYDTDIFFEQDGNVIKEYIRKKKVEIILGSSLEKEVAEDLEVPLVEVSFPVVNNLILSKGYAGYNGSINLLEDLGSRIINKIL